MGGHVRVLDEHVQEATIQHGGQKPLETILHEIPEVGRSFFRAVNGQNDSVELLAHAPHLLLRLSILAACDIFCIICILGRFVHLDAPRYAAKESAAHCSHHTLLEVLGHVGQILAVRPHVAVHRLLGLNEAGTAVVHPSGLHVSSAGFLLAGLLRVHACG